MSLQMNPPINPKDFYNISLNVDVRPDINESVPFCSLDACPSYDGKRCSVTGNRPYGVCVPAVTSMGEALAVRMIPSKKKR